MGNVSKGIISNLNESYIVSLEEAENNFIIALSKESVQVIANNIDNEDDLYEAYVKEIFTNKEDLEDENKIGYSTTINKDEAQRFSKFEAEDYAAKIKEQGGWNTVAAITEEEQLNEATTDLEEVREEYKEAYGMDLDNKRVPCVVARDKFLSGWGQAEGMKHYQIVLCGDSTEAANIESTMNANAKSEQISNIRIVYGIPKLGSVSYVVGRYARAWNDLSDDWYNSRFNTDANNNEEVTESEELKEEYSEKLGGDPEDFLSDMGKIKNCIMEIGKHTIATHLAEEVIMSFLETCDNQIAMVKSRFLGESENLNEDDRIMQDQNVIDIINSYSSRNNHLKYKVEGNSAIYEDGTEITFYLNDESEIEYTIKKDGNTTKAKLASHGLTESEEENDGIYRMKDCTTDVDIINALEGDTLELDDMEDWNRLKELARSLASSQGFYGRLLRDMEDAEPDIDEMNFPIYL